MAKVHPTAIVHPEARLAEDVEIGPGCIIDGPAVVGAGTRLLPHVILRGPIRLGARNVLYPNVCIGYEPQDRKVALGTTGAITIGDDNLLREGVTIHGPTKSPATVLGNRNFLMCNAHVGHDCILGDDITMANGVLLGGHVQVADRATFGGNAGVHQFCRVGRLSMLTGCGIITQDIPPFCAMHYPRSVDSLNIIGLRRNGHRASIPVLRTAFRILYYDQHALPRAIELIEQLGDPLCAELAQFLRTTRRGITPCRRKKGRADRSAVLGSADAAPEAPE